jgi:hypothetical protein
MQNTFMLSLCLILGVAPCLLLLIEAGVRLARDGQASDQWLNVYEFRTFSYAVAGLVVGGVPAIASFVVWPPGKQRWPVEVFRVLQVATWVISGFVLLSAVVHST